MLGLKMKVPVGDFITRLRAHGMLGIPAGDNVMRLLPPLIIEDEHVREAMRLLSETAAEFDTAKNAGARTGVAA
jgi:acetylornithine/N-succinyldiaminopimelate aminotransferase